MPIFSSCHLIDNKAKSKFNTQPESMKVYDFCDPSRADMVWTRPEIESKLNSLVDNPPVYNTIMEAYPHAYITMTGERDKERCGDGALVSGYEISNYINHLLADIMTRYLHKITKDCAENPALSIEDYGLCYNQKKFQDNPKLDSLTAFLESTSVYISSHIALSLSAVILDDSFWNRTDLSMTHAKGDRFPAINDRLFYVKRYKVNYDAFNKFLAVNLNTVSQALSDECLVAGNFLVLAAKAGQKIPLGAPLFEKIRTRAFEDALTVAKSFAKDPSEHPMIVRKADLL